MHTLKAAYTDRADGHPTMRCSCGYMCGAQSWEVVGRAMDRHVRLYAQHGPTSDQDRGEKAAAAINGDW